MPQTTTIVGSGNVAWSAAAWTLLTVSTSSSATLLRPSLGLVPRQPSRKWSRCSQPQLRETVSDDEEADQDAGLLLSCDACEKVLALFFCHDAISTAMKTSPQQCSVPEVLVGDIQSLEHSSTEKLRSGTVRGRCKSHRARP